MSDREQLEQRSWTQEEQREAMVQLDIITSKRGALKRTKEAERKGLFFAQWAINLQCELTAALASLKHQDEQLREARELLNSCHSPGEWHADQVNDCLTRNALPATGAETK